MEINRANVREFIKNDLKCHIHVPGHGVTVYLSDIVGTVTSQCYRPSAYKHLWPSEVPLVDVPDTTDFYGKVYLKWKKALTDAVKVELTALGFVRKSPKSCLWTRLNPPEE